MSLATPVSVQKLQTALHAKAKESPGYRFYVLYDKVYRKDILAHAYLCCKANGGAAGVDGQRFEDIQAYGEESCLDEPTASEVWRGCRPCTRRPQLLHAALQFLYPVLQTLVGGLQLRHFLSQSSVSSTSDSMTSEYPAHDHNKCLS